MERKPSLEAQSNSAMPRHNTPTLMEAEDGGVSSKFQAPRCSSCLFYSKEICNRATTCPRSAKRDGGRQPHRPAARRPEIFLKHALSRNHAIERPGKQKLRQDLQDEQDGLPIKERSPNGEHLFLMFPFGFIL